jgi:hypothetical protein
MQVYKAAKQLKISNKELIKLIDRPEVDHHLDNIPDELLEELGLNEKKISTPEPEPAQTVDSAETSVVKVDVKEPYENTETECPYTKKEIELGIRCLGGKAPQYKWRHMLSV